MATAQLAPKIGGHAGRHAGGQPERSRGGALLRHDAMDDGTLYLLHTLRMHLLHTLRMRAMMSALRRPHCPRAGPSRCLPIRCNDAGRDLSGRGRGSAAHPPHHGERTVWTSFKGSETSEGCRRGRWPRGRADRRQPGAGRLCTTPEPARGVAGAQRGPRGRQGVSHAAAGCLRSRKFAGRIPTRTPSRPKNQQSGGVTMFSMFRNTALVAVGAGLALRFR
jgi:hypothetical protein